MRFIKPVTTEGLEQLSPVVWRSTERDGVFVIDRPTASLPFLCFFVQIEKEHAAPGFTVDTGDGYDHRHAVAFRSFPLGFYHVPLAAVGSVRQVRFRASQGRTVFRCVIFQTAQPLLVAVLHYLYNLRYQKVGLVAAAPGGAVGAWALIKSNIARARQFFSTVSAGQALRVQQDDADVLAELCLAQARQARPVQDAMRASLAGRSALPLISFVAPVYNTRPEHLKDLIASFAAEDAPYAELILIDDGSTSAATRQALSWVGTLPGVRLETLPGNDGIAAATNAGIAIARGDWVAFIDHDDAFAAGAVAVIAQAIAGHPDAIFFYTDEVVTDAALRLTGSFCKPAYDSVLLSGMNYINHFSVFSRARLAALGGLSEDCEGSQDYDLLLRYLADARAGSVVHIPFLAYMWRRGEGSYSMIFRERSIANARRALKRAYSVDHRGVEVEAAHLDLHRVRFTAHPKPLISVVVPSRDSAALITRLVGDLETRTRYSDIEIVVADNGTTDPAVLALYEARRSDRFRVDLVPEPFNFSRMCNRGARLARGDALLFLNNDIEVIEPDWLTEMVECLAYSSVGIVGAKLLYPKGTIQHAGVVIGLGEAAGHWYVDADANEPGPMGRLAVRQTIGAVTGACMLVTRPCFQAVGGFDEDVFPIAYNDVDLCMRARHVGFRTIWTPFATLYHHESASRGSDEEGENNTRLRADMQRLQERHGTKTLVDDAYSPLYDRRYSRPNLVPQPALPASRRNAFG